MTFKSLNIECHPSRKSAQAAYVRGADFSLFGSLNAYTFPKPASAYAQEHGLAISYVDNSWVRIALSGEHLVRYLTFGAETEPDWAKLTAGINLKSWYVLNDEEF